MQKYERKEAKKYTQALRVNYAYIKKTDLSLEVNTAILEAFWISELKALNISALENHVKISLNLSYSG